ncbi:MAG: phosphate acyltransferase [Pseudomonadota bacterium]
MSAVPTIAVDCMGGDHGPQVTIPALRGLNELATLKLFGDCDQIRAVMASHDMIPEAFELVSAPDRLTSEAGLRQVLKRWPGTSTGAALACHRSGQAAAVVSAADTAALLALSRHLLGTAPGVERPMIAREFLGQRGAFWMADLGANVTCTPPQLHAFAHLTRKAAQLLSNIKQPRIALLNIGTEQGKGPAALRATASLMGADPELDFIGFVEPSELFENAADVVICDGLVGNIALKSIEGTATMARHLVRQEIQTTGPLQRAALSLLKPALQRIRESLDTDRYNGAQFLGLNGLVIKSHGAASQAAFGHAVRRAVVAVQHRLAGTTA